MTLTARRRTTPVTSGDRLPEGAADPLHRRVYARVADGIASGRLHPGERLPSERDLADMLGVSRVTVRRGLRQLIDDGLVESSVGRGSFVSRGPLAEPPNVLMSFTDLAASRGLTPGTRVLKRDVTSATLDAAAQFAIAPGAPILIVRRLRTLDGIPIAVDEVSVPTSVAPSLEGLDLESESIYGVLDRSGAAPVRGEVVARASLADDYLARHLQLKRGDPIMTVQTKTYDRSSRLVEIDEVAYRADRYEFRATLIRRR